MKTYKLFVIAIQISEYRRRARVRRILNMHGSPINKDTYEVATDELGIRSIRTALTLELAEEDISRIYPICRSCRRAVAIYGKGELETPPMAYIF